LSVTSARVDATHAERAPNAPGHASMHTFRASLSGSNVGLAALPKGHVGRAAYTLVAALVFSSACSRKTSPDATTLSFSREGQVVATLRLDELKAVSPPEQIAVYDPYYEKEKHFLALPLRPLLERGFPGASLAGHEVVVHARDGYAVPIPSAMIAERGAYLAIADSDVSGWEPFGTQHLNPGPFYMVWREPHQQHSKDYPRPYQIASIELTTFERLYGHMVPIGEAPESAAMRGFTLFRENCVRCHAINREGGRVGPELNVPQSIVEYRPAAQIRAYIHNPRAFRYGMMPAFEQLTDSDLDALLGYFDAMKSRKHDSGP
jgi:mono/diheme cytochrome c family protein